MSDRDTTAAEHEQRSATRLLRIRVSLKGRPIRTFSLVKDVITIGRDPGSDLQLDNPGISRHHLRIVRTPGGHRAEDLGSANGTYVNDELIQTRMLQDGDILRVGKFSLWVSYEADRRGSGRTSQASTPSAAQGTTVLSTDELEDMMVKLRQHDGDPNIISEVQRRPAPRQARLRLLAVVVLAFLLGTAVGACLLHLIAD